MKATQLSGGIVNKVRVIDDSITNPTTLTNALILKYDDQEVVVDRADAKTVLIPVGVQVGKTYRIIDIGAARCTVAGQTVGLDTVTVNSVSGLFVSTDQYGVIDIVVVGTNDCVVTGAV